MMVLFVRWIVGGFLSACALGAPASDEALSFRLGGAGDVLAVVSGFSDGCSVVMSDKADSLSVRPGNISLSSETRLPGCFIPHTPSPYEAIISLGHLDGTSYAVTWTQGAMTLRAHLIPALLEVPQVAKISFYSSAFRIVDPVDFNPSPYYVKVQDRHGRGVGGVAVVIAPAAGKDGPLLVDPFGFTGFNTVGQLSPRTPPLPEYVAVTDLYGVASARIPYYDKAPAAFVVGARVLRPFPEDLETFASTLLVSINLLLNPSLLVEYYHAALGHYFMTFRRDEIEQLEAGMKAGWKLSTGSFTVWGDHVAIYPTSFAPVCRFFSSRYTSHFFTADSRECDAVVAKWPDVWTLESRSDFYVGIPDPHTGACASGFQPVYRLYNNRPTPNHRFVTDARLRDAMEAQGWIREGIGPDGVVMCAQG